MQLVLLLFAILVRPVDLSRYRNFASQRLIKDILDPKSYDNKVRPVQNHTHTIKVVIRLNLFQILEVDEPNQKVRLSMAVTQIWKDQLLGWNPKEYDDINEIVVPYNEIWLPDTYLYNSLEMSRETSERWTTVVARSNGSGHAQMRFMYPAIFLFTCKMQIRFFPFDSQICTLTFGSWTYDERGVTYVPEDEIVLRESFIENEEWTVKKFTMSKQAMKYECCPYKWSFVLAHLHIERKPLYYLVNLLIPTSIISLVAIIGFFSSSGGERKEKVDLGITTLLAMAVLLLMVSDSMPTTSNYIPLIGIFFLSLIVLISLGTLMTCLVIFVQQQGLYGKPVPTSLRKLMFKRIARLIGVRPGAELREYWHALKDNNRSGKRTNETFLLPPPSNKEQILRVLDRSLEDINEDNHYSKGTTFPDPPDPLYLEPISEETEEYSESNKGDEKFSYTQLTTTNEDDVNGVKLEWDHMANVLDRMFLYSFTTAVFVLTFGVMLIGYLAQVSSSS